ncbi:3-hydroxyacyl-CoA dehydrogenase NAD-binding domain-containing protein [Croceicoccus sp. F390]|uniref:3-hydroxyacyl-CoA dehydrogenase NAD-binding domain-containing protein n=1 Tax=Croceicoccus esteveae TaxID=3075597 RepID=A0ABU2ZI24_9SPHN|nr:3-hydroxyacyl-CoA dehydrogenase NAD-binding domain-containing protein [Croceicoccus sp. F390]MDT0576253.1 3-hydroxyacyl-CoA dehydrogenase NAD-binding domain-containing protein [Croceicoccus sp. F390]
MRHMKLEKGADGVAILTLDNADVSMNVVSDEWLDDMNAAIADFRDDDSVTGVVVASGKKAFMAGVDLKFVVDAYETMSAKEAYAFSQKATAMHRALETMGKPVACIMNGLALGGGFELALACHHRILVDDLQAVVGLPEVTLGLLPGSGGTQRLPRIIGRKPALDLLLSGRSVAPQEALKLGIVDEVASADELMDKARQWLATDPPAERIWDVKGYAIPEMRGMIVPEVAMDYSIAVAGIVNKHGYNYPAPGAILSCVFEGLQMPMDKALSVESKYFAKLLTDPVARNMIRTTFISKQAAEKGARRPDAVAKSEVQKLGVLGAGMMGAGIALVSANAGIDVVLIDRDTSTAEKGKGYSEKVFGKAVERGRMTQDKADAALARINPTDDFAHLEGCDLVVEAVFEDLDIKAQTTKKAEAVLPDSAVFATNTSTLPISKLAKASKRPDQYIGLHFFSPVDRMGLVEVIMGEQTSEETLAKSLDFITQIRKTPIVVNDAQGFYTSRVFRMFIFEGAAMMADGVEPARIENAARAAGFPIGPLALLDEVTIDLPVKILKDAEGKEGNLYTIERGGQVLDRMLELGRGSRKAGGGFYEYAEDGTKRVWTRLAKEFPTSAEQPDQDELKKRFLYSQANETARCLEEGVLETPQDADVGALLGWGFPSWTGGTLSYIDTVGIEAFVEEAKRLAKAYGERFAPSAWLQEKAATQENFYSPVASKG